MIDAKLDRRPDHARSSSPRPKLAAIPSREGLRQAILRTVVYADLFDYALTRAEMRRYLIGLAASDDAVTSALDGDHQLRESICQTDEWFHLRGRENLAVLRRQRQMASARLLPVARRYARWIARLPFVRLVGLTGALAMKNARLDDDVDLFILVKPGRLWLCRLFVIAVVKLAARRGRDLCPNFLLSTDHLVLSERNLYSAHEVVQMVPLHASGWYPAFLKANGWVSQFVPNAYSEKLKALVPADEPSPAVGPAERLLATRLFGPLEGWEMRRKIRRLSTRRELEGGSTAFSADECRGHFAGHDARVLAAYRERLAEFGESF